MRFHNFFENNRERNDFFIAIAVILFFMWLMFHFVIRPLNFHENIQSFLPPFNSSILKSDDGQENSGFLNPRKQRDYFKKKRVIGDLDEDGIPDDQDSCKFIPGDTAIGCPDFDLDGIADKYDACPKIPGSAEFEGCPDSDLDSIPDHLDLCPEIAGSRAWQGCPDSDGDGIHDGIDECPHDVGVAENMGCPDTTKVSEEETKRIEEIATKVQFQYNSYILTQDTEKELLELVDILKRFPNTGIEVIGHTDSQGDDRSNLELSQLRAEACVEFLVSNGIDKNRLKPIGKGEELPIADNGTAEGRRKNRRVEIKPF